MKLPEIAAAFTVSFDGKIVAPGAGLLARRGKGSEPLRVLFSNSGRVPASLRSTPAVIFTTRAMTDALRRKLEKTADVRVEPRAKTIHLRRALEILARDYGVRSAVCEGDAELFRSLAMQNLVRILRVTFAPLVIGGAETPTLLGPAVSALLPRSIPLRLESFRRDGEGALASYRIGGANQTSASSLSSA